MDAPTRPVPQPTPLTQPYWDAAAQGRLAVQRCAGCGKLRHYPRLLCDACHSLDVNWQDLSARGTVHSWMVAHHAFHPGFRDALPYTLVTIDLEEGVRALGRWTGNADPTIGQAVRGRFVPREGTHDLVFEPA